MAVPCHSFYHSSFTTASLFSYIHNIPISTTSIPVASVNFSQFSSRGFGNRRYRNLAKSDGPDSETSQFSTQFSGKNGATSSSPSFLSFLCPLLKLFSGGDPSQQRNFTLEVTASSLASLARFAWGSKSVVEESQRKEITSDLPMRLQLFEFEACPFCRRVREAMTELDLSVEVYPCPKGSVRHREEVRRSGGKEQFPFLIDPNSGISMYESGDIVKYLFERYGEGRIPSTGLLESTLFTGWMPTVLRAGRGMTLWERSRADPPPELLELFSYENNPYARIVREALCELELPYILHNVGEGSHRRKLLFAVSGSKEVPYIIDANTGFQSGNYKMILSYLFQTYSAATVLISKILIYEDYDLPLHASNRIPKEFAEQVLKVAEQYNGFNLMLADIHVRSMVYVTNRPKQDNPSVSQLTPGIHVLTKGNLDWMLLGQKAERLRHNFKELLDQYGESELPIKEMVKKLMANTIKDDEKLLPGIRPPEREYPLSSVFVEGRFGTRSSSALCVKSNGEVTFYEKYLDEEEWKEKMVTYQINETMSCRD